MQPANSIPDANPIPAANSIPAANPIASTNSIPLTDPDINSTNSNHERSNPTTSGRTNNALLFFNTILDSFSNSNDINVSDIETIGGLGNMFADLSGNSTSEVILNLLNELNRTNR